MEFSAHRMEVLWEDCIIGFAQITEDGSFMRANPAFCKLVRYTERELCSKKVQDITEPTDSQSEILSAKDVHDGVRSSYFMDKRFITKTGEIIWVKLKATAWRDSNGGFECFLTQAAPPQMTQDPPKIIIERYALSAFTESLTKAFLSSKVSTALSGLVSAAIAAFATWLLSK